MWTRIRAALVVGVLGTSLQWKSVESNSHRGRAMSTASAFAIRSPRVRPRQRVLQSSYGLYEIQEEMLVKRGVYEEELMQNGSGGSTPLLATTVKKGVDGRKKGFGAKASTKTSAKASSTKTSPTATTTSAKSRFTAEAAAYASQLRTEGVVRINDVLSPERANRLRDYVTSLRHDSVQQVNDGTVDASERFADVLLRSNRCDLKLPLACSETEKEPQTPVTAALHDILCDSSVAETIATLISDQAVLYELSCLISDPGSQRQVVHPDNPYLERTQQPTLLTCFVALQDVDVTMGPTVFLPRTHTAEAHAAFANDSVPSVDADDATATPLSPKDTLLRTTPFVMSTLTKGSCAIFDSRLLHCGSANRSATSRAIFYVSFRNPSIAYPGNPASIRADVGAAQFALCDLVSMVRDMEHDASNPLAH